MPDPRHENETTPEQIEEAIRVLENQARFSLPNTAVGYLWAAKSLRLDMAHDVLLAKYVDNKLILPA